MKKLLVLFLIFSCLGISPLSTARAKEKDEKKAPEASQKKKLQLWELSLKECILLTLKDNLDIRIEGYNPLIFDTLVDQALAGETGGPAFDPTLKASFQYTSLHTPVFVDTGAAFQGIPGAQGATEADKSQSMGVSLSLEQRFLTGTSYVFSYTHSYRKTDRTFGLNPQYKPSFSLTVNQSLLKGLGPVANETEIIVARNNRLLSDETFKLQIIRIIQDAENRYWDVVQAYQNLELKRKSLEVAQELLHIAKLKYQIGTAPSIEVTAAQSALASRKAEIIEARNRWKNTSDLLVSLFMHPEKLRTFERVVMPLDRPKHRRGEAKLEEKILLALKNRSELAQLKLDLANKDIVLENADHNLLPTLDLSGTLTFNGLGGNLEDSFRFVRPQKFYDWQVGMSFSYPIFQRAAKSRYQKALLEKRQSILKLLTQRRDVFVQVRQAYRNLRTAKEAMVSRQEASKFALEKLDGEKTRYSVGKSTNHKVFQIEEEYTQAKTLEIESQISIVKANLSLDVASGTLLKRYKIQFNKLLPR